MRLATVRAGSGTRAVRVEGDEYVDLGYADLSELLADPDWREHAADAQTALATVKDEESFKAEFPKVMKNCGGCHEKFRKPS